METWQRKKWNLGTQIWGTGLLSRPSTEKKQQDYNEEYKGEKGRDKQQVRKA